MRRFLYLEFLYVIKDYFQTVRLKEAIFDLLLPLSLGTLFFVFYCGIYPSFKGDDWLKGLNLSALNIIAILVGFTVASITVFVSSSNSNIEKLKTIKTKRKVGGKEVNLFQLALLTQFFVLFGELLCLIYNLIIAFLPCFYLNNGRLFSSLNVFMFSMVICLNIRNICNMHFIFGCNK